MMETINRAAIYHDNVIYTVPRPLRHHDVIHMMAKMGFPATATRAQGFTTSSGRFVNRMEGRKVAESAGQIVRSTGPDYLLFSEDMW